MNEATVDSPIVTLNGFEAERERWDRLYRADPSSQIFLSHAWFSAFLRIAPRGWRILVLRDGDALVAALPLRIAHVPSGLLPIARQLTFASAPVGDYQGMLCLPGREAEALTAFAAAIGTLRWDQAFFRDVADDRVRELIGRLGAAGYSVDSAGTARCPRVALPATWDEYAKSLGAGTRGTTVRSLRRLREALPGFRVTSPADGDIDAHVDAMARLRHARWGGNLRSGRAKFGRLNRAAYDTGCLRSIVMWDGERPIAGAASYVDPVRGSYNLYQLSYDAAYAKYSPGKGAIGLAIRDAIERGFSFFDFLRGDEDYKFSYAPEALTITHHVVRRPGLRAALYEAIRPTYRTVKKAAARVVYRLWRAA